MSIKLISIRRNHIELGRIDVNNLLIRMMFIYWVWNLENFGGGYDISSIFF